MGIPVKELQIYKDFDELALDILEMAKEVMPDKLVYLTTFTSKQQIILKLSETPTTILLSEGMAIDLNDTVCNRIDFNRNQPLIFEDVRQETRLDDLRKTLVEANINSYLGVPIILSNGEPFGTLCSADSTASHFNEKSIKMLQRLAKMFSYYLDLERMAFRDFLTGLYNRQFLTKYFEDVLPTSSGTLFFLDLDGFKKINDIYGHETGDLILKEVALRLEKFVDEQNGFAVRLGGDEFIINMTDMTSKEELSKRAECLLLNLSSWDTQLEEGPLSVSIGIASYPQGLTSNLSLLLKKADHALYAAKAAGKNTYHFFE